MSSTKKKELDLSIKTATILIEQKARDVCIIDLKGISDIADYFVIASGSSQKHVQGLSDKVHETLKPLGESVISTTGKVNGEWIIMDYATFIVHIFYEPTRQFYDLDSLYKEAKRVPLPKELENHAKKLRTGMYHCTDLWKFSAKKEKSNKIAINEQITC